MSTRFGSLRDFEKGGVEIIQDDPRNYVFSNVFEVAAKSSAYERVAVGKNFEYVIEAVRAEGMSPWYSASHDEFVLAMDGSIEVHLVKPSEALVPEAQGAHRVSDEEVAGQKMGRIILGRGHMALLPAGSAYRFQAEQPGAMIIQTIEGPETVFKWESICQTEPFPQDSSRSGQA